MRKILIYIPVYITYWLGLLFNKLCNIFPNSGIPYRFYNWFMVKSCLMEEWANTEIVWVKTK